RSDSSSGSRLTASSASGNYWSISFASRVRLYRLRHEDSACRGRHHQSRLGSLVENLRRSAQQIQSAGERTAGIGGVAPAAGKRRGRQIIAALPAYLSGEPREYAGRSDQQRCQEKWSSRKIHIAAAANRDRECLCKQGEPEHI